MTNEDAELLVADSFRVRVNEAADRTEARLFDSHVDRFRDSVASALEDAADDDWWELVFEPFLDTVPGLIDRGGEGFPRLELWRHLETDELLPRVHLRPLPKLGRTLELRTVAAEPLCLSMPWVKGPNIGTFTKLNAALGAEALLLDQHGQVTEGVTTSLLWWSDGKLHVSAHADRVASITEMLITSIAINEGIEVEAAQTTPAELSGCEVWAVNALHGLRYVTAIDGAELRAPNRRRLASFRDALEHTWTPVLGWDAGELED